MCWQPRSPVSSSTRNVRALQPLLLCRFFLCLSKWVSNFFQSLSWCYQHGCRAKANLQSAGSSWDRQLCSSSSSHRYTRCIDTRHMLPVSYRLQVDASLQPLQPCSLQCALKLQCTRSEKPLKMCATLHTAQAAHCTAHQNDPAPEGKPWGGTASSRSRGRAKRISSWLHCHGYRCCPGT